MDLIQTKLVGAFEDSFDSFLHLSVCYCGTYEHARAHFRHVQVNC